MLSDETRDVLITLVLLVIAWIVAGLCDAALFGV